MNISFQVCYNISSIFCNIQFSYRLEFIYTLEASNAYLRQRIMQLPERVLIGTHNTELEFKRRLKAYNDLGDELHPAKFFEDVDRSSETISMLLTDRHR
jgi:hypothetical protein